MKLDLMKFDHYVKDKGLKPSDLLEDANMFNPSNLKKNDADQRFLLLCDSANVRVIFNEPTIADVIAQKFMEATYNHIEDLSDNADKIDFQQKVDKLKEDMGTRLKHIFDTNEKDGNICYDNY